MKVKQLFNIEQVRICKADEDDEWCGYAFSIPKNIIDKVCSFPCEDLDSCTYILLK